MRPIFLLIALSSVAACAAPPPVEPGSLSLTNLNFGPTWVEAVVTANPDCGARDAGYVSSLAFVLPNDATRFIEAPPGADVCWRTDQNPVYLTGKWAGWSRAYLAPGRRIDAGL